MSFETNRPVTHKRRLRTDWYDRFAPERMPGLDIGCGDDPIHPGSTFWTRYDRCLNSVADAHTLVGLPFPKVYQTVYASHVLEHLEDPWTAVANWAQRVIAGGHLIVVVPHRDLYEKQAVLPSRWNADHKSLWLPDRTVLPYTLCLADVVEDGVRRHHAQRWRMNHILTLNENYIRGEADEHPNGEYSIEIIMERLK